MSRILRDQIKSKFNFGGTQPNKWGGSDPKSTLHNTSSINNKPSIAPIIPSELDLDGKQPKKYMDNPPK
jgi:hypothetical protein